MTETADKTTPTITHDGVLDVALGRSRNTAVWKNKELTWSSIVKKLSQTHRTAETFATYITSTKSRQDEIKDIGGFVGGYLANGRRKNGSVLHRQLLCLDIDFGTGSAWDDYTLLYNNAAALYSTHKHQADAPRYRLVIPLSRPVDPEEYVAIGRRIAGNLDIERFDPTTFEPTRLMYWPSTAKDAEYIFESLDGPWLNADEVLATFKNWRDSSEWPMADRETAIMDHEVKKVGDPTEKTGMIGAFCRAYDVPSAIATFLPEVYIGADDEGSAARYTYVAGTTAGGLVLYSEGMFAYSHHGTDPAGGKLCNAFDLVRLHLYGAQDEDCRPETPMNRRPSFLAMEKLAMADKAVRAQLATERMAAINNDFGTPLPAAADTTAEDVEWQTVLDMDRKGNILNTERNYELIFNNDPALKGLLRWDNFQRRAVLGGNMPWREVKPGTTALSDWDQVELTKWLSHKYGLNSREKIEAEIMSTAFRKQYNSLQEWVNSLEWDGTPRVDALLVDYQGAEDTEYVRTVTGKTLIACIARALDPGCKVDTVLTMVSKEGNYKSTLIDRLGGDWFSDSFNFGLLKHGNKADEHLQGVWLLEIPELTGLGKADVEMVKAFITRRKDNFRVVFAKHMSSFPRQCVFFGTTNNVDFLQGSTGNRRFWPVDVGILKPAKSVHTDLTKEEVAQIWAEARVRYEKEETWWLDKAQEKMALEAQQQHTFMDDRMGLVQAYLDTKLPPDWAAKDIMTRRTWLALPASEREQTGFVERTQVSVAEICCEALGFVPGTLTTNNTKPIHAIMQLMSGWERAPYKSSVPGPYNKQFVYIREGDNPPTDGAELRSENPF